VILCKIAPCTFEKYAVVVELWASQNSHFLQFWLDLAVFFIVTDKVWKLHITAIIAANMDFEFMLQKSI